MLFRRIYQFLIIYFLGILLLFALKILLNLSDYVIPGPLSIWQTFHREFNRFLLNVLNTLGVAVVGQVASVCMALAVGIIGRQATWFGSFVKVAAYNIQAYPIVAIAPIIFILMGDGFASRLLIAAMICYFPLLLSMVGIMSEPIEDIEHFYRVTGRMRWQLEVKIRAFENLSKLTTVISGSATLAMAGTIVAEFIAANAGIGYSIRIALYQSDLSKVLVALFLIGITLSVYQGLLEWVGRWAKNRWASA
ncbi:MULTISPECIES: ABC transporter permease [Desulfococcus]|jgi:NitT/TauT family transport system permease protein|uniref:ABC-type transporter, integral membrane subunit n=1 Tax=Desulfococcus multivorans DSM 2059 TaxID=1121405 RepID=S7TTT2_DESML|nr:ABC transporter permease subunit [Desulfococcus multivorans]AOY58695.1 putative ABC transporter, permease protein [Desulfococcus multivorans]AQV00982.1 ABC transporter permease [Desulfococcus multivorans]EPR40150.1 ABC-type transporter, integral membrane subunit [Desulfococcus multivorans DSM 2059]MDX9819051.1 ABC transporter permease subunit [Desulfococcus multivorans]SJZ46461.1 Binding-protein-dependent transport system inner membrane component [Desulfococcus multivorans DSM 2059]